MTDEPVNKQLDEKLDEIELAFSNGRTADACNMIEDLIASERDKAELIGVAKILDNLWDNSYYGLGKDASKRIESEMVHYFGDNWSHDMYELIIQDGKSQRSCHPVMPLTLKTIKENTNE